MKIRKLSILNFRGVKKLDWTLPDRNIFCLIGKGDASKSTILDSIRFAFYPSWNLSLNDSDFYLANTSSPIKIEVSISDLPEDFYASTKYGNYLRGWDSKAQKLFDEPDDHLEEILTIRFLLENDLEPTWRVICDRYPEGIDFRYSDRIKVGVTLIGAYSERQFSWANGSALEKLTEAQDLNEALIHASRTARDSLGDRRDTSLKNFDKAAQKTEAIAKSLGVPVKDKYQAHLDHSALNIKIGGLMLHDGQIPLKSLGLGSRRMLLCGIQKTSLPSGHITLFDEVELGLEPHRIARLAKHIREDNSGQYLLTTHSPAVLRELTIDDLHIVHNLNGLVNVISVAQIEQNGHKTQGKIRSSAEAFLSKKIIVCEGATEVGILRGFDDYQIGLGKEPFCFHGVALLDARGGGNVKEMAKAIFAMKYDVCVFADTDAKEQLSQADIEELEEMGIPAIVWDNKCALEERAMNDLPWEYVLRSVLFAREGLHFSVRDQVQNQFQSDLPDLVEEWKDTPELRAAIGKTAKNKGWFKDISRGMSWFEIFAPAFSNSEFLKTDLSKKLNSLWSWVEHD